MRVSESGSIHFCEVNYNIWGITNGSGKGFFCAALNTGEGKMRNTAASSLLGILIKALSIPLGR